MPGLHKKRLLVPIIVTGSLCLIGLPKTVPADVEATADLEEQDALEPSPHRLSWDFPRVRPWQYVTAGLFTAANLYIQFVGVEIEKVSWTGPILFDEQVRNWLVADSDETISRVRTVSDFLWHSTQYYPVVVDSLIVPLLFDDWNTDVALQMTIINWQTLGMTGLVTRLGHVTIGRTRPFIHGCSDEVGSDFPCEESSGSFFSGHVSMSAAGAALSCAHHAALPLYGHGPAGAITCGVLAANAVTVGILRIVADRHWATDVLLGHFVGAGIGFGLPWLLHYGQRLSPDLSAVGISHAAFVPWATSESASLRLIGAF